MLVRAVPMSELDRLVQQWAGITGTWSRPSPIPVDAWRAGGDYMIAFDLPGVRPEAIDIGIERNELTVTAERRPAGQTDQVRMEHSERPLGVFSRRLVLSDALDTGRIEADYEDGVLTLRVPFAERAEPRKIAVGRRPRSAETGRTGD
ncbi:Hsp20/alpha crystallin family protein [Streptomyces sp. NPDC018019]|uniref:Hsp20/alpha crystallin family protein n=1 Tax=Streptomyces sp. NPDC018019 TaxID=3365030 RepID=UPI00378E84C5